MSARIALAVATGCLLFLTIALIGGGWFSLGRVDPLLALPGAGWASAAALVVARRHHVAATALVAAAAVILIGACLFAGAVPPVVPTAVTLAGMALAAALSGAALARTRRLLAARPHLRRAALAVVVVAIGVAWQVAAWRVVPLFYVAQVDEGPRVTLVTSLPLQAAADIDARLNGQGATTAFVEVLRLRTDLVVADSIDAAALARTNALLLAHPRILSPQELVAIDAWVRRGGKALILADGLSTWPPPYPMGDPRNPPVSSLLTPLLTHWGLRLDAPRDGHGIQNFMIGEQRLRLASPGYFLASSESGCRVTGPLADCRLGAGRALLLADADFLHEDLWRGAGYGGRESWSAANVGWVTDSLFALAGSAPPRGFAQPVWLNMQGLAPDDHQSGH